MAARPPDAELGRGRLGVTPSAVLAALTTRLLLGERRPAILAVAALAAPLGPLLRDLILRQTGGDYSVDARPLGTDGPQLGEQARRIKVFCHAYGIDAEHQVLFVIVAAVAVNSEQLRAEARVGDVEWWQEQLGWLNRHRDELEPRLLAQP